MVGEIKTIDCKTAWEFLEPRHYSPRKPSISVAYGWYIDEELVAVCTFGKPANRYLCSGICGEEYSSHVYELNRLCRVDGLNYPLSQFVGGCLRWLKPRHWIVVSYSDTAMHHNGYIYQACNFLYTGQTKPHLDYCCHNNTHNRQATAEDKKSVYRRIRTIKNRYVYFCTNSKKEKELWGGALRYPILPYPKEPNQNYELGTKQKDIIIDIRSGLITEENQ